MRLEAPQELRRVQGRFGIRCKLFLQVNEVFGGVYIVVEFPFVHLQIERVIFIYRLL